MAKVRELRIPEMWANMHRLQDEDFSDPDETPDEDEIYGLVVVVERDKTNRPVDVIVGGSDVTITFGVADRDKWITLSPQGDWLRRDFDASSVLEVTWILMEEDSVLTTELGEAITELTEGLLEEVEDAVPGIARVKSLFGLVNRFVAKATQDDRLGSREQVFSLANDPVTKVREAFPCKGKNADYDAWARADLGQVKEV